MRNNQSRGIQRQDKNSRIMNIMNLKLAEESRKNNKKGVLQNPTSNIRNILINTPSTHATQKQFRSLQLTRKQQEKSIYRQPVHYSLQKSNNMGSNTKILTVNQIKHQTRYTFNTEQHNTSLIRQKSKGIFVSISKRNSVSRQKNKNGQINLKPQDCKMTHQQPKIVQKRKINIYRDIARGRNMLNRQL